jgi:hypothetical protein
MITKFKISLFLLLPITQNNKIWLKKKRSIKRRIFKKLINFNNKF